MPHNPKIFYSVDNLLVELSKHTNKKIVFTNGCFDLLHKGHLHLLQEAKQKGDILIVAINTDTSVKALKGNTRPIEILETRIQNLAMLHIIDYIIAFNELTPLTLIQKIQPNILVKGGDYLPENIIGYKEVLKNKGEIIIIPLLANYSTTSIIEQKNAL